MAITERWLSYGWKGSELRRYKNLYSGLPKAECPHPFQIQDISTYCQAATLPSCFNRRTCDQKAEDKDGFRL